MFDRISNSFTLARSSWQILRTDKQLIVFPIISGIACLLILLSFALPFIVHPQWLDFMNQNNPQGRQVPPWVYIVAFAYYFCNYFVVPVLVVEKVGPIDAVKRSMSILRKTWGEALVGHFGIGFFVFLLALPGVLLLFVAVALGMVNPVAGVALGVLAVLYLALA